MNLDHEHMDEIMAIAEQLQAEMHTTIDYIRSTSKNKDLTEESLKTSYMLMKMADLERKMNKLDERLNNIIKSTPN